MNKKIFSYCSQQDKSSPDVNELLTEANNANGIYYTQKCFLDSALYYFKNALRLATKKIDSRYIDIAINMADMYTRKGEYVNGIGYFRKALETTDSLGLIQKMGFPIYLGLGQAYYSGLRDFRLSEKYFDLAWRYYPQRTLNEQFVYCNNRANSYYYQQKYKQALLWFLKAKALVPPAKYQFFANLCYANLSDIYLKLGRLDSAQYYLDRSMRFFASSKGTTIFYYLTTVKASLAMKEGRVAEAHSLLSADPTTKLIEPEIAGIRNQCWQDYYVKVGDYKNAYKSLLQNTLMNDSIRNEKIANRIAEIDLRYKQDTAVIKRELLLVQQSGQISSLRMANYFWALLVFVIIAGGFLLYHSLQRKRAIQRMMHQEQTAQLRLQNIRNRISPHLMFNVLNREMSSGNGQDNQNLFDLVKLLRKSLEFTEQTLIPLNDELDFVKTYIDLERTKLGDDFEWSLKVDETVDTANVKLPAMMIQIPVENALKHGLRNKTGNKRLSIDISGKNEGVQILVSDNGNGYHPSEHSDTKGTGTGLKVLYQTLQLLNLKNKSQITFTIRNITEPEQTGTVADIYIPNNYHV
jgi:tetratricopeptide (TPR) repeat protein